jgi:hypothetical protein
MSDRFRTFLLAEKASHQLAITRIDRELEVLGEALPVRTPAAIQAILRRHPDGLEVGAIMDAFEEAGRVVTYAAVSKALSRLVRERLVERTGRGAYRLVEGVADPAMPTDQAPLVQVPGRAERAPAEPEEGQDPEP